MREVLTKGTFQTLKKLKVVNEAASKEIEKIKKKEKEDDLDSEFWNDSDQGPPVILFDLIHTGGAT